MTRAWLALGSNAPRADSFVRAAFRSLHLLPLTRLVKTSSLFATAAVGGPLQRDFVNAAALIETSLTPMGLLVECKRLEAAAGRRPGPRWGPRPLDVDILAFGSLRTRSRLITLPHPLAAQRRFVLAPLAELAPRLRLPGWKASAADLLQRVKDSVQNAKILTSSRRKRPHG